MRQSFPFYFPTKLHPKKFGMREKSKINFLNTLFKMKHSVYLRNVMGALLVVYSEPKTKQGHKPFYRCNGWGGKFPLISVREPHANTEQQITNQEEAEKLTTELQCSLKQKKHLFCCPSSNSVRERIPGFLVQRCGFPSQEAQEVQTDSRSPKSGRQPVISNKMCGHRTRLPGL